MHLPAFATLVAALAFTALAQAQDLISLLKATPDLSTLTELVSRFPDIVSALGTATNVTILAPSNEAFRKFLRSPEAAGASNATVKAILQYHVLSKKLPASEFKTTPTFVPTLLDNNAYTNVTGGQVVEGIVKGTDVKIISGLRAESTVVKADIGFDGGVIHVIDKVLTVPPKISITALNLGLTTLAGALTTADLVNVVDTTPDLTVFAPTNAAFAELVASLNLSSLSTLTLAQLTNVLEYHVVKGTVAYSTTLRDGEVIQTLNSQSVTITISGGNVFVNKAKVVIADVLVANGVAHVIDSVLNPSDASGSGGSNSTSTGSATNASGVASSTPTTATATATATGSPIATSTGAASSMKSGSLEMAISFAGIWCLVQYLL